MPATDAPSSPDGQRLEQLLEAWFIRVDAGESPDPEEHCREAPELLARFRRIVGRQQDGVDALLGATTAAVVSDATPKIDDFEVLSLIGSGGRGDVYLARQRSLARLVGLKILRADAAANPHARRRFLREAEIAAGLEHDNIVPIYAVGETEAHAYIAMKWLSGPALDEIELPRDAREVAKIGAAVARGLHEAHQAGIIHRDVKPGNVMLDGTVPRLLDFGLARVVDDLTKTRDAEVSGTLPYMSPEQLRAGASMATVDARTDVYSLGATLFELAVGHPPFEAPEPASLIRRILLTDASVPKSIDVDLRTILARALEKDREDRFPSAIAMAEDLERFANGLPIRSRPIGPLRRGWKIAQRHKRATAAIAVALMVSAVIAGLWAWDRIEERAAVRVERAQVIRAIERGDVREAKALYDVVARRDPDADSLGALVDANRLLEELVDHVQDRALAIDRAEVKRLIDRIEALGGPGASEARSRLWKLARCAAAVLIEDEAHARAYASALSEGRARRAFEHAMARTVWPWQLPDAKPGDATDRLFTAIAMRAAGVPSAVIASEVEAAYRLDEVDYRVTLQWLYWHSQHGDEPRAALQGFRGLVREGKRTRAVRRALINQAIKLRDDELIARYATQFETSVSPREWNRVDAHQLIEAYDRLTDHTRASALLAESRERWPDDWYLRLLEARALSTQGKLAAALAVADAARTTAITPRQRDRVDLVRLAYRAQLDARAGDAASVERVAGEALELAKRAPSRVERAEAWAVASRAYRSLGRNEDAGRLLERSLAEYPTPSAVIAKVEARYAEARAHYDAARKDEACESAKDGLAALELLNPKRAPLRPPTPLDRVWLSYYTAGLAVIAGDADRARLAAETGIEIAKRAMPEAQHAGIVRVLEQFIQG